MGSALRLSIHSNNTSMMAAVVLIRDLAGKTRSFAETFFAAASVLVLSSLFLNRMPMTDPANAAANQTQPCRLPDEIPLKYAPTLHPNAMRALYPIITPANSITSQTPGLVDWTWGSSLP